MIKLLNFDKILKEATSHYYSLSDKKQKRITEELSHGKALLDNNDQMKAYIHLYGEIHRKKLLNALSNIPDIFFKHPFSVIDWGCGQGLASIVLIDYLESLGIAECSISDLTLVEPSRHCLGQAIAYVSWCAPDLDITGISKKEEDLSYADLSLKPKRILHLLSNVIDMPEFEAEGVRNYIDCYYDIRQIVVCVSPFYPKNGRGGRMSEFGKRLNGFKRIYSFERHIDDWREDFSCQIQIYDNDK